MEFITLCKKARQDWRDIENSFMFGHMCCYCRKGIGLNGPNCRTPYEECCRCGHRRERFGDWRNWIW